MRHFVLVAAILLVALLVAPATEAQVRATATQTVTINVNPIFKLAITGNPTLSIIDQTTPGGPNLDPVTENTSTFSLTQNRPTTSLSVSLNTNLPSGLTLTVSVPTVLGATNPGVVQIQDGTAHSVLTNLTSRGSAQNQPITYALSATTAAAPLNQAYTVTWTLTE